LAKVEEVFRQRHTEQGDLPFPEPPLPEEPDRIIALRDARAVGREGDEQCNCAASLIPDVISGWKYLYTVRVLERASLVLRRASTGRWVVDDLKARNNRPPSWETTNFVETWLAAYQPETKPSSDEDCPL
jgi:hypothetical protein